MNIQLSTGQPLLARFALMIYADTQWQEGVVMQHALSHDGQGVCLAEGTPVTTDLIKKLSELNQQQSLKFIPSTVVAQGIGSLAWVEERQTRPLLFGGAYDKSLAELDGKPFPQPRLLFTVSGRQVSIYALRGHGRPGPETPLYRAPYFNIFSNNQMCVGSVRLPSGIVDPAHIPQWTEAFFLSNFVKPADSSKRWSYPGTHRELWDAAAAGGEFKDEWLVEAGTTLGQLLGGK